MAINKDTGGYLDTDRDGKSDYGEGIPGAPLPVTPADGVVTGLSLVGETLTMTRSEGLPPLSKDLSGMLPIDLVDLSGARIGKIGV